MSLSRAEQPYQVLAPLADVKDLYTMVSGPIDDKVTGSGYDETAMSLYGHSVTWKTMNIDDEASPAGRLFGPVAPNSGRS